MSTALTLSGFGPRVSVEIAPEAHALKEEALGNAALVSAVTTPGQQEFAVTALRMIKTVVKGIEEARKEIKAPVLTLGKDIDAAATKFQFDLLQEDLRLTKLISTYQAAEIERARKAEAARMAELKRIEDERLAREREIQRQADEEAKKARTLEQADAAARTAEVLRAKANVTATMATAAAYIATAAPARAEGMQVRTVTRFEVLDIRDLAFKRPDLVNITPNVAAINAALKRGETITSLRVWEETVAGVRT